jgi:hypothetical protein
MRSGKELPPGQVLQISEGALFYKTDFGDLSVPVDQIEQIVFASGVKDREGIFLSSGDWISGLVRVYKNGIWDIVTDFGTVRVDKPGFVSSVHFAKPKVSILKAIEKKGISSRYVVDWLYSQEISIVQNQEEWSFWIKKITIINNQILVDGFIQCKKKMLYINPRFKIEDEFGNRYDPIASTFLDGEYSYLESKTGKVTFPSLRTGSNTLTIFVGHHTPSVPTPRLEIADLLM